MSRRKIKDKFKCVYCGKPVMKMAGEWMLSSVEAYSPNSKKEKKTIISGCYAHPECYIKKYENLLLCGIVPVYANAKCYKSKENIIDIMKMNEINPETLRKKIYFLKRILRGFDDDFGAD